MITLELGNTYKTRAGDSVRIRDLGDDFRFYGDIVGAEGKHVRIASFSPSGQYSVTAQPSQFDVVGAA